MFTLFGQEIVSLADDGENNDDNNKKWHMPLKLEKDEMLGGFRPNCTASSKQHRLPFEKDALRFIHGKLVSKQFSSYRVQYSLSSLSHC